MKTHLLHLLVSSIAIANALLVLGQRSPSSSSNQEVEALLAIKASLIDHLDRLKDWTAENGGNLHCNWTGVTCGGAGLVERLDLSYMNLSGRISPAIQKLSSLTTLNLCCNAFESTLPRSLSGLASLRVLDLSLNSFFGTFPAGLDRALGLVSVNASGNNFSGSLPEDVGNATSLESLDFRGGFFQGGIPVSYKNLQRLKFLGLSGNNLTGRIPGELGHLSSLEKIIIGYNEFEGSIPAEFGNLTKLQYLDVAFGNLDGKIPAELGRLKSLTTVFLYKNNLEGEIPPSLGNVTFLQQLDLSDNMLSGAIPAELAMIKGLQLLNLMCNRLTGDVPAGFGDLTQLAVLELWNNSLTGPLPANLGRNSPLQWLDVSSNSFTGEIPDGVCTAGNLTKLILFNNRFSGNIPKSLSSCSSLIRVRIHENLISGPIPFGFGSLTKLQRLELASNNLSGEVPDDLALSSSLTFIDVSHNLLQSTLPYNILTIPNLQSFSASSNRLSGNIPDQFQDCPFLAELDLSSNRFSGSIPASLASCEKLVNLNLRENQVTGEIPLPIATMPALAIIDLSRNNLTGRLPQNFGSSPALEILNVSYNQLTGPVPANGILRTINPDDLAGNRGLCGGILPPCYSTSAFSPSSSGLKKDHLKHIIAGWVIGVSVVLAAGMAILGGKRVYQRWQINGGCCNDRFGTDSGEWPWRLTAFQRLNFTSGDILAAIKESNVIGMGATGVVYRAEVQRPHSVVAVKKLWRSNAGGAAAMEGNDLAGEVNLLGKLRHRNIVRLLGHLHNETETMIIYEYMPNGSLGEALHGKHSGDVLVDWVSRYNIAVGVAQGLAYLHHDCSPPVIHRDVKSNNILLDVNLEARIADFGLARLMLRKNETVSMVAGSYGYIAPEYGYTLKVDEKSDIYSYGVVLMELITGRRPVEAEFEEGVDLVEWVRSKMRNNTGVEALDQAVGVKCNYIQEEMLLVLRVALLCTAKSPKDRPSMRDVLTLLGEAKPRRKSSSSINIVALADNKDKPVFSTSPAQDLL